MIEAMLPDSCSRVRTGGLAAVWPPAMPRGSMSGPRRGPRGEEPPGASDAS